MSPAQEAAPPALRGLARWAPGWWTLRHYRRDWLRDDLLAGIVLTAVLVPVGMGYSVASGLPAIHGLYATVLPLLVYALLGPSRIMVVGPDSTLVGVIAAVALPMSGGDVQRAVALGSALAICAGVFLTLISLLRLGFMADLFSKPIRLGFLNAIALTVLISQAPKLLGVSVKSSHLLGKLWGMGQAVVEGRVNPVALAVGGGSLALILGLKRWRPSWPGVLLAVVGATLAAVLLQLHARHGLAVVGPMPMGLPLPSLPDVSLAEAGKLLTAGAVIALLVFADTSVLSRALAVRSGQRVNPNQEMLALGVANVVSGLFQGIAVSASSSRTPVAESAGSRSQLTGVVGAVVIMGLLLAAPGLLADLPEATLAAVVIAACLSFADIPAMRLLYRQRRGEFWLSVASFLGVAFVGVIEGVGIAIVLALLVLVWNAWHPYHAVLVRVDGRKGYHDVQRHPEGRYVPGLVLFRWDAELFFANAELFRERVLQAVEVAPTATRWVVIVADAITDIDVTAADVLSGLDRELEDAGIQLRFAGLKGPVKDWLVRYGLNHQFDPTHFDPTEGVSVNLYRKQHTVDWKDWDEV